MDSVAVTLERPGEIALRRLPLDPPGEADAVVEVAWSGVSAGTERLLHEGRMPPFPGLGYPLVPGYEAVGRVSRAGPLSGRREGETVFVGGARCFGPVRGLFGSSASRLVVPGARAVPLPESLDERAVLLALAATARRAVSGGLPDLIVGHGALGRLAARLAVALGGRPTVWEREPARMGGAEGYEVLRPEEDPVRDRDRILEAGGDASVLDDLVARLRPGGEVVLAGFYAVPLTLTFPPAFLREARLRVSAEWRAADLEGVLALLGAGRLSLDGIVSHRRPAGEAPEAMRQAFGEPDCLKMVLDWRDAA